MFNFLTIFLVLFFGLNCFCFHTFSEHPIFLQFLFSIGYQPSYDGFLPTAWEGICPKLILLNFEAPQNLLSIVLNFSQLSSFDIS